MQSTTPNRPKLSVWVLSKINTDLKSSGVRKKRERNGKNKVAKHYRIAKKFYRCFIFNKPTASAHWSKATFETEEALFKKDANRRISSDTWASWSDRNRDYRRRRFGHVPAAEISPNNRITWDGKYRRDFTHQPNGIARKKFFFSPIREQFFDGRHYGVGFHRWAVG